MRRALQEEQVTRTSDEVELGTLHRRRYQPIPSFRGTSFRVQIKSHTLRSFTKDEALLL